MLNITVMIMSYNEEKNIKFTLDSVVNRFNQIIVTDSYSKDKTLEVCKGYQNLDIYEHEFIHWADQRNWMLQNCDIKNDWVFFLDADESIGEEFFNELNEIFEQIKNTEDITNIFVRKDFFFLGKHLKYSYAHPYIKLIFNRKKGLKFIADGAREYALIDGGSLTLKKGLHHEDRRSFDTWIVKHIKNANRECNQFYKNLEEPNKQKQDDISFKNSLKLFIRKNIWNNIPLGVRPFFYFLFRYFGQLGFLDGKEGLIFCVNHALWYQMLIDVKIIEKRNNDV
jgi:glycosyltransferase involved in cell wall biosynthesis